MHGRLLALSHPRWSQSPPARTQLIDTERQLRSSPLCLPALLPDVCMTMSGPSARARRLLIEALCLGSISCPWSRLPAPPRSCQKTPRLRRPHPASLKVLQPCLCTPVGPRRPMTPGQAACRFATDASWTPCAAIYTVLNFRHTLTAGPGWDLPSDDGYLAIYK